MGVHKSRMLPKKAFVAQWIECHVTAMDVVGSSPAKRNFIQNFFMLPCNGRRVAL